MAPDPFATWNKIGDDDDEGEYDSDGDDDAFVDYTAVESDENIFSIKIMPFFVIVGFPGYRYTERL